MKISTAVRYFFLAVFNAAAFYVIPLAISFESWFLLLIIGLITILINFTYLTERFKALKWITPGFIFLIAFVLFPAGYSFYVSFTNWSTGHILTKQQAIERLEDLSYSLDDQKGVEFDLYVLQDQNLDFYYIADLDDENILFGQAITDDEYDDKYFANHEPSLKNSNGEIVIPENFYQLSGKEQIANSSQLQDLALLVDKNTRIKLYNISVFGASSGRLSSSQQKYSYDVDTDTLFDNSKNLSCELGFRGNFVCGGEIVDPGWRINVGGENYQRIVNDQRLRGPLNIVTSWTFQFAILSVSLAFFVGLLLAVTLNNEKVKFQKKPFRIHPATKTFQALRIFINNELEEIKNLIDHSINIMAPGARLVLISFHSLEDRLVKNTFNKLCGKKNTANRHLPTHDSIVKPKFIKVGKSFLVPTEKEIFKNPKARSAKLRVIERVNI